jgi:hypothetical protein
MAKPQSEKYLRNIAIILLLQLLTSTVGLYVMLTVFAEALRDTWSLTF